MNGNGEYNYYDNFKVNFPDRDRNEKGKIKTPWKDSLEDLPMFLDYFEGTIYEVAENTANEYPKNIAYEFMGENVKYKAFIKDINSCAKALKTIGVKAGEKVAICMPNLPQTVTMFYAVNMVGGISVMLHPLSSEKEIIRFIEETESTVCLTLDMFSEKFKDVELRTLIVTGIGDVLSPVKKLVYKITVGKNIKDVNTKEGLLLWNDFLKNGEKYNGEDKAKRDKNDPGTMLYSGGTTGISKAVVLSNYNINALAEQMIASNPVLKSGDRLLAIMPMFHGFGLESVHTMVTLGGRSILIPRLEPKKFAKLVMKHKPNLLVVVPALFEVMLRTDYLKDADLSFLKAVGSGGDTLSYDLKHRLDKFLKERGCKVQIREGYGLTECTTVSSSCPIHTYKEGRIGVPLPDMYYKICKVGTDEELPYGEEGEICLTGPTLMLGYYKNEEESKKALHEHEDGYTWLHTGDLGTMDEDGYISFTQRLKRMIVTNGYNVYPTIVEAVLDSHDKIHQSCVIGIPDKIRGQKVYAYAVLVPGVLPSEELKEDILKHCEKRISKYALPKTIEFRDDFPKTLIGKVAYRVLEEEINHGA